MKLPLARAFALLALAVLAGCAAAVGVGFETEERKPAFVHGQLEGLIGSSKEEIIAHLDEPQYELLGKSESYFVYQEWVDAAGVIWFILPFPVWGEDVVLRCSMFEFDEDDLVSHFELTGPLHFEAVAQGGPYPPKDCKEVLWTEAELGEFRDGKKAKIEKLAHEGDPVAQYQYGFQLNDYSKAWKWYCLAAHQGYAKAQYDLGHYYRWGRGPNPPDPVRAYLWYSLAGDTGFALSFKDQVVADMSPAQIAEAERLVAEWKPNPAECDAELEPLTKEVGISEYKRRADAGDPLAMFEYANSLPIGAGLERLQWYCRAAHTGYVKARYQLGRYYEHGWVIERNSVQAYIWYSLASEAGHAHGNWARLSQGMTPAQIAEAERLVAEWEPNPAECEGIAAQAGN